MTHCGSRQRSASARQIGSRRMPSSSRSTRRVGSPCTSTRCCHCSSSCGRALASAQTGAMVSRLPQWISCQSLARRAPNRPLACCMACWLISSICPRTLGISASWMLGRVFRSWLARPRPRRLRATSRLSAGLSRALSARLASRRMDNASVGLPCNWSAISRSEATAVAQRGVQAGIVAGGDRQGLPVELFEPGGEAVCHGCRARCRRGGELAFRVFGL